MAGEVGGQRSHGSIARSQEELDTKKLESRDDDACKDKAGRGTKL